MTMTKVGFLAALFLVVTASPALAQVGPDGMPPPQGGYGYGQQPPPGYGQPPAAPPRAPGWRFGVGGLFALPTGDFDEGGYVDTGFGFVGRGAYEMYMGQIGLSVGGRLSFTRWAVDGAPFGTDDFAVGSGIFDLEGRASYYVGRFIPYGALGIGYEQLTDDVDFAVDPEGGFHMGLNLGFDYMVNDNLGVGGFIGLHLVQPDIYDAPGIGPAERFDIGVLVSFY
jgi:hypothetical protein